MNKHKAQNVGKENQDAVSTLNPIQSVGHSVVTQKEAEEIVQNLLNAQDDGGDWVVLPEHTTEHDFGWVVSWNSKVYVETGDMNQVLIGNAPYIVTKAGEVYETGTALPTEEYIKIFEESMDTEDMTNQNSNEGAPVHNDKEGVVLNKQLAEAAVRERLPEDDHKWVIQPEKTTSHLFGWVVYHDTKKFVETGDWMYQVPGTAPSVVSYGDGQLTQLSSAIPFVEQIEQYAGDWLKTNPELDVHQNALEVAARLMERGGFDASAYDFYLKKPHIDGVVDFTEVSYVKKSNPNEKGSIRINHSTLGYKFD